MRLGEAQATVCCDGRVLIQDDDPRALLDRGQLGRMVTRLRGLSLDRLKRPDGQGITPASRTHDCAQHLADLAADAAGAPDVRYRHWRPMGQPTS